MNIILIGMRGSGKSTIGRLLAKRLNRSFIEMDTLIEKKVEMSIREIVSNHGWKTFRGLESEVVQDASKQNHAVIGTGGGVVLKKENVTALKKNGHIIWLHAPVDILLKRIGNDSDRPLLTNAKTMKEDLQRTLDERNHLYQSAANFTIDISEKSKDQICQEIENSI